MYLGSWVTGVEAQTGSRWPWLAEGLIKVQKPIKIRPGNWWVYTVA